MERKRFTLAAALLAIISSVVGCMEQRPAYSPAELTGATIVDTTRTDIAELQRERNEARATLEKERAERAQDRARMKTMQEARDAHDLLEKRALDVLERTSGVVAELRAKSAKVDATKRQEIEKTINDARQAEAKLYADLKRIHGELANGLPESFRQEVAATIAQLEHIAASFSQKQRSNSKEAP